MPRYVDGFVIPIPTRKIAAYRKIAQQACKVWMEYGALDYKECVLEDKKVYCGPGFLKGVKAKSGETLIFAYIVYKSRKDRDRINAKVMKDPRLAEMCDPKDMPFDGNRMLYGGFEVLVSN